MEGLIEPIEQAIKRAVRLAGGQTEARERAVGCGEDLTDRVAAHRIAALRVDEGAEVIWSDPNDARRVEREVGDLLLPDVERGTVRLIGATTHNPFFYINSPLVSRSQVFQLEPLTPASLIALQKRALADPERGFGRQKIEITDEALTHLATVADGDARRCLNALEIAVVTTPPAGCGSE